MQWTCEACTLVNEAGSQACEACGTPANGPAASGSRSDDEDEEDEESEDNVSFAEEEEDTSNVPAELAEGFTRIKEEQAAQELLSLLHHTSPAAASMALPKLSGDEQCIIFSQLCNTLDPGVAVAFGSTSSELRALIPALLQQLRADYEVAAALCRTMGMSCKELREAQKVFWVNKGLTAPDLATLGTLGSLLPALLELRLSDEAAGPDGVQRLAEKLGAGALPAVTALILDMHVGDAGASALAAALGRDALPRLKWLTLSNAAIGDAGLVALAPALRRQPKLEKLGLSRSTFGDEGLAALVAPPPPDPPPPAGAPPKGGLTKLKTLILSETQVTDAGCAVLAAALGSGALPALETLSLQRTLASDAAKTGVRAARDRLLIKR